MIVIIIKKKQQKSTNYIQSEKFLKYTKRKVFESTKEQSDQKMNFDSFEDFIFLYFSNVKLTNTFQYHTHTRRETSKHQLSKTRGKKRRFINIINRNELNMFRAIKASLGDTRQK